MLPLQYLFIGGEMFIAETLHAIQDQTYKNINVIISLDGPQPKVAAICQDFLTDSRFHCVVQSQRLGWVAHINLLMAQVDTPYWYCNAHDDLVHPCYVETLVNAAQQMPDAAVVYADLLGFGNQTFKLSQASVTGSAFLRQLTLLHEHFSAVAFRGLTRVSALRQAGAIPANSIQSFASDTIWMLAMARWGELRRVPVPLYQKRYHPGNEHAAWFTWSAERITQAYLRHCAAMLEQAMYVEATPEQRQLLWLASVERLLSTPFGFATSVHTPAARLELFTQFLAYLRQYTNPGVPSWLEQSWSSIEQWTTDFFKVYAQARYCWHP